MRQRLTHLDRIAGQMNAWMLLIAIGLSMLDLTVLVAKFLPPALPLPSATIDAGTEHGSGG